MKNYKKLKIWEKGFEIAIKTFDIAKTLPAEEKYGIASQMKRAGMSIPLNIAEGSGRKSEKEYSYYRSIKEIHFQ